MANRAGYSPASQGTRLARPEKLNNRPLTITELINDSPGINTLAGSPGEGEDNTQ